MIVGLTVRALLRDEAGFILSAELVLVLTVGVLSMVVGLHQVAKSIDTELVDVAHAFGTLNQSYHYRGAKGHKACVSGSEFNDGEDLCDCATLIHVPPTAKVQGHGSGNG